MKLVILDRDGVINHDSTAYIKSPDEWRPIAGSLDAIARLNQSGFHVALATNQAGLGRGLFDMGTLNAIHTKMHLLLSQVGGHIDAIFFCPHRADDLCDCRKPKTGLLEDIAQRFNTSLKNVPLIGDSLRDLQAAEAAGATPILVLTGNGKKTQLDPLMPRNTRIYPDLATAVSALVE